MSNDVEIAKKAWMEEGNSAREWNILDTNEQMDYIKKIRNKMEDKMNENIKFRANLMAAEKKPSRNENCINHDNETIDGEEYNNKGQFVKCDKGKFVKPLGGGKKSRRKTRSSKKSHRKSSKKSHRKSRRGGKSRRGRR